MVEHVDIPDGERHEPKGAGSAASNTVLHANGDGSTGFRYVNYLTDIINKPILNGYQTVLSSFSGSTQNPTALDTPLQVSFGSAQTNADVSLASNGLVTFNTAGAYTITLFLRFGRVSGTGTSVLLNRFLINGVQGLNSNACAISDATATYPFSTTLGLNVIQNDTFVLQIMRDSSGNNSGGLIATTPVLPSWNISPSATIIISKFSGS